MKFVSFFSGVGGFDLALLRAGHKVVGACELDPAARRVYEARFGTPVWFPPDLTQLRAEDIPDADGWCGGSPCQDFSVAGKRKGLKGDRSSLVMTWLDLARKMKKRKPQWLWIENVPGMLSGEDDAEEADAGSDGAEGASGRAARGWSMDEPPAGIASWMGAILGAMADCGYRDFAYRTFDAKFSGVPQRRRRIFVVGHHGDGARAFPILFEPDSRCRNPPTRQAPKARSSGRSARDLGTSGEAGSLRSDDGRRGRVGDEGDLVVGPLQGGGKRGQSVDAEGAAGGHLIVEPTAYQQQGTNVGPMGTLRATDNHTNGVPFLIVEGDSAASTPDLPRLRAGGGRAGEAFISFDPKQSGADAGEDVSPTLRAGAHRRSHANGGIAPAVAYSIPANGPRGRNGRETEDAGPLSTNGADHTTSDGTLLVEEKRFWDGSDLADTLDASVALKQQTMPEKRRFNAALDGKGIRRFTPLECERLQGFPDGWTCLCDAKGVTQLCTCPDGPRYRMLGNSVAIPVVEWIAKRFPLDPKTSA